MSRRLLWNRVVLFSLLVLAGLITGARKAYTEDDAFTKGQGFGIRNVVNVRGTRVFMYTGNPPGTTLPGTFNVSLTAVCADYPCTSNSYFFETGWYKGILSLNQLRHYDSWVGPTSASYKIDLGVLSANTWYEFQTLFSNTTYSWEAWRGGIPRHQIFLGEDFKKGNYVSCGLETGIIGSSFPSFSTSCTETKYKVGSGGWTLYDYGAKQIFGPYCVNRWANYEVHAYKC